MTSWKSFSWIPKLEMDYQRPQSVLLWNSALDVELNDGQACDTSTGSPLIGLVDREEEVERSDSALSIHLCTNATCLCALSQMDAGFGTRNNLSIALIEMMNRNPERENISSQRYGLSRETYLGRNLPTHCLTISLTPSSI